MQYEVEQKHRVANVDALIARLIERGAILEPPVGQSDQYFAHPSRDFAKTDEALRIRTVGGQSFVTYKGPRLDSTTKTRRELELPLTSHDNDGTQFVELLRALGFRPVAIVRKNRQAFQIELHGRDVEGALDDVNGIGTFVELELLAGDANVEEAQRIVSALAIQLALGPAERRSYLEMLMSK